MSEQFTFQAEIQQLLHILVHSLYTDRDIFLRELISNASDALHRARFEALTNHAMRDADAELYVEIHADADAGTLTVSDTGIGMTHDDMVTNLGTIARSGAKAFIEALKANGGTAEDVIGQFGVGFYSAFMVADRIRVVSRAWQPDATAFVWESDGGTTFTIEPAEREVRGTDVTLYLKDDAKEYLQEPKLRSIVRRHSNYVAFPIYVGSKEEAVNEQQALWRQSPSEVSAEQYNEFYQSYSFDPTPPLRHLHVRADVPLQFYALLFFPGGRERSPFSTRREPGLTLYARKVLIQEYQKDLLPEYLSWVEGVVDSEDLPLNVNRESVQVNRVMVNLKKTLTGRVLSELKRMAKNERESYLALFELFGRALKQGVALVPADRDDLLPLLVFPSSRGGDAQDRVSLDDYVGRMAANQNDIYYLLADDIAGAARSPHLDAFRQRGVEVLFWVDPMDAVLPVSLTEYKGHKLRGVDEADIDLKDVGEAQDSAPAGEALAEDSFEALRARFKAILGEQVRDVVASRTLTDAPARLVSGDDGIGQRMYRLDRLLNREVQMPIKTLELNPRHALLHNLSALPEDSPLLRLVVEQVFETALLQEGLHPDPAAMAGRLLALMQAATGTPPADLPTES